VVQEEIYRFIKDGITTLRFGPGTRLRAAGLAALVQASRTPVREALGRLEQEGLVRRDDGWGYVVSQTSVKDLLELYGIREVLEVFAATQLVPQLDKETMAELDAINRRAEGLFEERRYEAFLDENRRFHAAIARITGNRLLQQMLGMIQDRVRLVGSMTVALHEPRARELLLTNRRIMAAIRKRDAESLEAAMRVHIRLGREQALRLIHGTDIDAIRSDAEPMARRPRARRDAAKRSRTPKRMPRS
jgi:DNA-binding GntR family transcriptional regulator